MTEYVLKLEKKILISGIIETKTGLHIGGSNQGLEIGGVDNAIIRDPLTNQPYIPGSSLKGKMRSLLEKVDGIPANGETHNDNGVCIDPNNKIAQVFGVPAEKAISEKPSSRLIVYDAYLTTKSKKALFNSKFTDAPYSEIKTEIIVDRVTSAATPRPVERVPKGAEFEFEFVLNVFEGDEEKEYVKLIENGIQLLNDDYLGGSGTRGSGRVSIHSIEKKVKTADDYTKGTPSWNSYDS